MLVMLAGMTLDHAIRVLAILAVLMSQTLPLLQYSSKLQAETTSTPFIKPQQMNLLAENMRTTVYWDPEAGRFVSSTRGAGSSSQVRGTELLYTDQSIFFGGPLVNEQLSRGGRTGGSLGPSQDRGPASSHYQQSRPQRGGQLPVFVPSDSQQNLYSSSNHMEDRGWKPVFVGRLLVKNGYSCNPVIAVHISDVELKVKDSWENGVCDFDKPRIVIPGDLKAEDNGDSHPYSF
ncbi:hypothetical protein OIU78_012954 [Salix suchowensis]|nr:hypothetical protein OIU78_012954 [Salix suchowensis]